MTTFKCKMRVLQPHLLLISKRGETSKMQSDFLRRIDKLCAEQKISKRTLEKEAGLSSGSTSKWKNKLPGQASLIKLSKYFNVSTDYLIGVENEPITIILSAHEQKVIEAYRTNPQKQEVVDVLLGVTDETTAFAK